MVERIISYIAAFLALLIVLPVHEFAHAFAAVKSGDDTPRMIGRYTLNPFKHFDIVGLICMVLVHFGWAKPVQVNPDNFKHRTLDSIWVAVSGVLANLCTAFVICPLYMLSLRLPATNVFYLLIQFTLGYMFSMSVGFAVFNILPLMPLDGFRIIQSLTKRENRFRVFMEKYSGYFLLFLIVLDFIGEIGMQYVPAFAYIRVLNMSLGWLSSQVEMPILMLWGLIF